MASTDFIQKRIAGKEKEIDKLEKKLARIWRAKESTAYWYTPGYFSSVWQLRRIFRSMDRLFKEAGYLKEKGYTLDLDSIDNLIESAVLELKKS